VLETLLDAPPPPPPPDVPALPEERGEGRKTLRQRLEEHRANPTCASCHARMDPIGFGLEAFDGIGAHRADDGGDPLDTKGTLTTGESFDGALDLVAVLARAKKDLFMRALASRLLTYALGRGLEANERCTVIDVVRRAGEDGHRLAAFVRAVVESAPFLDTR
jgi:hypothetical protein